MVWCIPLKASQARPKVGPCSIFMKLALCEIGFCLMDPCMGALPDTSAPAYRHQSRTEDRKTEQGKRRKGTGNNVTRKWGRNLFLNPQRKKKKRKKAAGRTGSVITENSVEQFFHLVIKPRLQPKTVPLTLLAVGLCRCKSASSNTWTHKQQSWRCRTLG